MDIRRLLYLICVGLSLAIAPLQAQKKSKQLRNLESKRASILQKIKNTDKELSKIKRDAAQESKRLQLVRQQVSQRKEAIGILGSEISALQYQIDSLGIKIRHLSNREGRLKEQYAASLRAIQMGNPSAEKLLFLLSAQSLQEAYQRQKFLGQYALANQTIVKELKKTRLGIEQTQQTINENQNEKKELLAIRDNEKRQLEQEEGKRVAQVQSLKGKEAELSKVLAKQKQEAQRLESQIEAVIAAEIARAQETERRRREQREARAKARAEAAARRKREPKESAKPTAQPTEKPRKEAPEREEEPEEHERRSAVAGGYAMDAEERKLSGSFAQNKGRLPMPVKGRYDLVRRFGRQQHATLSKITIDNGGIDLRPHSDKHAYAVFAGVVAYVFKTEGMANSVLVRHGNYFTVYSNLSSVSVRSGQQVRLGQSLGTISSQGGSDRAGVLHFQLWRDRAKQNPSAWIGR